MMDTLAEKIFRYFVANKARILSIRRARGVQGFTPTRTGNSQGFFFWGWQVSWRTPYADVWAFDFAQRRWRPSYELKEPA